MEAQGFWTEYGEAAKTAIGFFWKAGWAFVLGYFVSGMIQSFVPKKKLTRYMGKPNVRSVSIATAFGSASSSCSFAALSAARSLILKGAHFIAAVAFMFASTNLVIELGILILIFLGWQFLAAEIIGGLLMILISSLLIRLTYPKSWLEEAREKVEEEALEEEGDFDWRKRIKSREGWYMAGSRFVMEWKMVWAEILIGFTIAGFVAVFVPDYVWSAIFLSDMQDSLPSWLIALENAVVGPVVAALTFIGSMGNIPLATVLNSNNVLFAGIMAFIYSDLMVPPIVRVNAKYYGWRVALYIAGIMFASIVLTALILNALFALIGIIPQGGGEISQITQFKIDYTFFMNLLFLILAGILIWFHSKYSEMKDGGHDKESGGGGFNIGLKKIIVFLFIAILAGGMISFFLTR